ncbi:glycine receptor subunit beta-type 4-like [Penaeus chinensis]|uniref:glycine receptor subunit beta-type 4-like n=1 Tax=Penaeus chinensis TaxID=139456 RepID=UPI001FB63219|nr:glycine receptor subunit beta-type 4-like [Penaeus chinensis]
MAGHVPALAGASRTRRRRSSDNHRQERGHSRRVLVLVGTLALCLPLGECQSVNNLKILDNLLKDYDRRATPTNHLNNATTVNCELYIRSFGSIDPNSMDYQVDLYLRQSWVDERLNHDDIKQPLDLNDPNLVKAIWKPEVYFPNAKHAEFQFVTVPNVLVRINPSGEILYMLRLKLVFACMMELSKFPLDSQVCTMEIASFSKTMKELNLSWKSDAPIKMYKNMRMPQFEMEEIVPTTCQESFQIGNYSCLVAEFRMRRSIGFHLVQSYLPTTLIVVISWVSFWMDVDSVPGRTTLGVTTLLTVSSKSSASPAETVLTPAVRYTGVDYPVLQLSISFQTSKEPHPLLDIRRTNRWLSVDLKRSWLRYRCAGINSSASSPGEECTLGTIGQDWTEGSLAQMHRSSCSTESLSLSAWKPNHTRTMSTKPKIPNKDAKATRKMCGVQRPQTYPPGKTEGDIVRYNFGWKGTLLNNTIANPRYLLAANCSKCLVRSTVCVNSNTSAHMIIFRTPESVVPIIPEFELSFHILFRELIIQAGGAKGVQSKALDVWGTCQRS